MKILSESDFKYVGKKNESLRCLKLHDICSRFTLKEKPKMLKKKLRMEINYDAQSVWVDGKAY